MNKPKVIVTRKWPAEVEAQLKEHYDVQLNKTDSFPLYIDLPGGGRENNESPYETFKREVKEEFGFKITKKDILYAKQYVSAMDASKESYFIVVRLNVTEKDIVFGDEGLDFFLIETENYLKLNDAIRRQQNRVLDYINSKK